MSEIENIKLKIAGLESMIRTYREQYFKAHEKSLGLTIESLESQLEQLQDELYQENRKREKEVVVLQLKGYQADAGSLPLLTVSDLTEDLAKGIFHISKYIQYGNSNPKDANKIIEETIDLRLYDVQRGSTKLLISGSTSPDLFGNSLLQESLDSIINFLNSDTQEKVIENIEQVGIDSIPHLSNLLKILNDNHLEANLTWDSPSMDLETWFGTSDRILQLYNTLTAIKSETPEIRTFDGEIITLSIRRKLEIQTSEGLIRISVPQNLKEVIKQFNVGGYISCEVDVIKTIVASTGKEKVDNVLRMIQEITPPNNA